MCVCVSDFFFFKHKTAYEVRISDWSSDVCSSGLTVETALAGLDDGSLRVATSTGEHRWQVNQWLKKAVLLSFRLFDMALVPGGPDGPRSDERRVGQASVSTGRSRRSTYH